ncbi:hypothetical protein E2C01_028543 [Portunus trituberculatus]|uniref:Uncharacterized protein n=1 Tax=Portunus trituberculatus TaxID=210409 RepID=A0A5B7EPD1_PORTR|nr:hypothetical protein [Portunus trituberculatus]
MIPDRRTHAPSPSPVPSSTLITVALTECTQKMLR